MPKHKYTINVHVGDKYFSYSIFADSEKEARIEALRRANMGLAYMDLVVETISVEPTDTTDTTAKLECKLKNMECRLRNHATWLQNMLSDIELELEKIGERLE